MAKSENINPNRPVDSTAGRVVRPGEHYHPDKTIDAVMSETPIPVKPVSKKVAGRIIGQRQGSLVVIGSARDYENRWVVRCDCGQYTIRRSKSINNPNNSDDCCEYCRHMLWQRRVDEQRRSDR